MAAPKALRELVRVGNVYDVTNHYIRREDHPCYGTTRRTVTKVNGSSFCMESPDGADHQRQEWPKADRFTVEEGGIVKFYGGGVAQEATNLFLTFAPVI